MNIIYAGAVDMTGTISVHRMEQHGASTSDTLMTLEPSVNRAVPCCAAQLAYTLLVDCLGDVARGRRLQQPLADLLMSPLLLHSDWILTSEDIEDAVQAIETCNGWLWFDDGYYLDENPSLMPEEMN